MNIQVEFAKKDLIKKLGCIWKKDINMWHCPIYNTDDNFEKLIALQDAGEIGFTTGRNISYSRCGSYIKKPNEILYTLNTGGPTYCYVICFTREQIYEKVNKFKANKKLKELKEIKETKVDEFDDSDDSDLTTEQLLEKQIMKLKKERINKIDELKQKQIEELEKLEEHYEDELRHLNNCKFRDYDPDIRSWN